MNYVRSKSKRNPDPKPEEANLYWIQRVITNYPPGQPGVRRSYIDNVNTMTGGNATHPYYGRGTRINTSGYFGDRPYRPENLDQDYYWIAELYLAEANELNPREITIYNGVRWGWQYKFFPAPINSDAPCSGECPPPPPPCHGGSGGGGCASARRAFASHSPVSVPESTSALGLLVLGAWGTVQALKLRKDKQQ